MDVLIISNMYPSNKNQQYGLFVKNLHQKILELHQVQFHFCVSTEKPTNSLASIIKYTRLLLSVLSFCLLRRKKIDLIHVHYGYPTIVFGQLAKFLLGCPMLVTLHGSDVENFIAKKSFHSSIFKKFLQKANAINPVSQHLADLILKHSQIDSKKIFIQNMGVDLSIFSAQAQKQYTWNRFAFIGNVTDLKNPLFFIEFINRILKKDANATAHLVGAGELLDACKEKIKQHGIEKNITLHGRLTQPEINSLLHKVDFLITPSKKESFGLVVVEAMATGTIPFVNRTGGLKDVVENHRTGFQFNIENEDTILECYNLFKNLSDDKKMGMALATTQESQKYSIEKIAQVFYKKYDDLVKIKSTSSDS